MKQVIRKKTSPNKVRMKQKEDANKQQLKGPTIPDTAVPNNENIPYGAGHIIQTKRLCPCDGSCPTCSLQRKTEGIKGGSGNNGQVGEGTPGAGLKTAVDNAKNSGSGTPMEKKEGDYFRKQLGYDFSNVKIHTGDTSSQLAGQLNARAFTLQNHIFFKHGEYQPGKPEGQKLMAHELTHVVQQTKGSSQQISPKRKKKTKKTNFYRYVEDKFKQLEKTKKKGTYDEDPYQYQGYKILLELCKELDKGSGADIEKIKRNFNLFLYSNYRYARGIMTEKLYFEISRRLFLVGLDAEAMELRTHFIAKANWIKQSETKTRYNERGVFWQQLADGMLAEIKTNPPNSGKSENQLKALLLILKGIQKEKKKITLEDIKKEQPRYQSIQVGGYKEGTERGLFMILSEALATVIIAINWALQQLTEQQVNQLQKGQTTAYAKLSAIEGYIQKALKHLAIDNRTRKSQVEVTSKDFSKMKLKDTFKQKDKKRRIGFTLFNPDTDEEKEKKLKLETLLIIRSDQIKVLKILYRPKRHAVLPKSKKQTGKGMQLHNVEDWRRLVQIKYKKRFNLKKNKFGALIHVIDFLETYLKAFTTSISHNIPDLGKPKDNYLTRKYPRALTGQLLHDCGVYALKIAYILSTLLKTLGLRIRYALMPNHIALIIDGKSKDSPLIVVNNKSFSYYSAAQWKALKKRWSTWKRHGSKSTRKLDKSDQQFQADLAVYSFLGTHIDAPVKFFDIKQPGRMRSQRQVKRYQKKMWKKYQKRSQYKLIKKTSEENKDGGFNPGYRFEVKYLEINNKYKEFNNKYVVPFWYDTAAQLFREFEMGVKRAADDKKREVARKQYLYKLWAEKKKVDSKLQEFFNYSQALSAEYRQLTKIHNNKNTISEGMRFDKYHIEQPYQKILHKHAKNVLSGRFIPNYKATPKSKTPPAAKIEPSQWKAHKKEIMGDTETESLHPGLITSLVMNEKFFKKSPFVSNGKNDPIHEIE